MAPRDPGSVLGCHLSSASGDKTPLSPQIPFMQLPQDSGGDMPRGGPLGSLWSRELISTLVLMALKVLGGLLCLLGREASVTMAGRARAGSWRLGFHHLPVSDSGPRFS